MILKRIRVVKNAQDIEALLYESSMKEVFRNVRIAEKIEDIL